MMCTSSRGIFNISQVNPLAPLPSVHICRVDTIIIPSTTNDSVTHNAMYKIRRHALVVTAWVACRVQNHRVSDNRLLSQASADRTLIDEGMRRHGGGGGVLFKEICELMSRILSARRRMQARWSRDGIFTIASSFIIPWIAIHNVVLYIKKSRMLPAWKTM